MGKIKHTEETIRNVARKYDTRGAFSSKDKRVYSAAVRRGILDDVCGHMAPSTRAEVIRSWDVYYDVFTEARKYKNRVEFKKGSSGCYAAASRNGWLDLVCVHMEILKRGRHVTTQVEGA